MIYCSFWRLFHYPPGRAWPLAKLEQHRAANATREHSVFLPISFSGLSSWRFPLSVCRSRAGSRPVRVAISRQKTDSITKRLLPPRTDAAQHIHIREAKRKKKLVRCRSALSPIYTIDSRQSATATAHKHQNNASRKNTGKPPLTINIIFIINNILWRFFKKTKINKKFLLTCCR